jgi:hypothetical protein
VEDFALGIAAPFAGLSAVVERLELSEFVGELLEQIAEPPHQARAIARQNARPRTRLGRGKNQIVAR